jgi:hypothetical protein
LDRVEIDGTCDDDEEQNQPQRCCGDDAEAASGPAGWIEEPRGGGVRAGKFQQGRGSAQFNNPDRSCRAKDEQGGLEVRVAKLERTVARLREQNKALKRAAVDAAEQRDALESARQAKTAARAAKPRRAPAKKRRGKTRMQQLGDGGAEANLDDSEADD